MSVESSRLAAAQRTAAGRKRTGTSRRWTRPVSWLLIVPMLACFSFSIVANARGFGKPDYEAAIKQLGPVKTLVVLKGGGKPEVCSVTDGQAAALGAQWPTGWTTMSYDGASVRALWVAAPNDKALRDALGEGNCKLVRQKSVFYLPFNANLS
jgi:hypothetical protein